MVTTSSRNGIINGQSVESFDGRRRKNVSGHGQSENLSANAFEVGGAFVGLGDFAGGSDGVDKPVSRIVAANEKLAQDVAAFVFGEQELIGEQFDGFNGIVFKWDLSSFAHFVDGEQEFSFVDSSANDVLNFHEESFVVLREGFVAVDFVSGIVRKIDLATDVIFLLCKVFANQSVLADEPEDERFDAQTAETDFAVGNDKAGLNHVADTNFGFELAIDDFDVQVRRRDFAGFDVRAFHLIDDGQNSRAQFKVVEPTITVGQKSPNIAVKNTNHATFGLLSQPSVDVLVEQMRNGDLHFLVIAERDVKPSGDLLMSDFADRESERLVIDGQAQSRAEGIGLHFERTSIGEEILPIESLALKLSAKLRQCFALFQGYLLQSKKLSLSTEP